VSSKLDVRLGPQMMAAVEAFKAESGMESMSAAARALIQMGLDRGGAVDAQWRRIAWREAAVAVQAKIKATIGRAVEQILEEEP
jgi:hypothetical protein